MATIVAIYIFADRTGLEPATSAVTGRHSNQLNYRSSTEGAKIVIFINNQTLFLLEDYCVFDSGVYSRNAK
jgi:hypothetical protein